MPEVRLQIPEDLVDQIQSKVGGSYKPTDMAKDAMTLLNWAIEERSKGRLVLSSDNEGQKMTRLAMPSLERAAPKES